MTVTMVRHSAARARAGNFLVAMLTSAAALSPVHAEESTWRPQRNVEIVVSAGPGGNQDLTARAIQAIWQQQKIVPSTVVMNKQGGGGAIAYHYMSQHARDPHYLLMLAPTLLTNHIMGRTNFRHTDFTPVGMLFDEYIFVSVKADSPLKTGKDLIERLKAAPDSQSLAVASALGNHIHMGVALPMKAAGVDIKRMKVVAFKSSGQSLTALLGGHVDLAASTLATILPHLEAGRVRVIGVSAPRRLGGALSKIPTWSEQGARAAFSGWRGMAAASNIDPSQVKYWESALATLVRTDAWKADVAKNHRESNHMGSAETRKFLDEQYGELESALTELGLSKTAK